MPNGRFLRRRENQPRQFISTKKYFFFLYSCGDGSAFHFSFVSPFPLIITLSPPSSWYPTLRLWFVCPGHPLHLHTHTHTLTPVPQSLILVRLSWFLPIHTHSHTVVSYSSALVCLSWASLPLPHTHTNTPWYSVSGPGMFVLGISPSATHAHTHTYTLVPHSGLWYV